MIYKPVISTLVIISLIFFSFVVTADDALKSAVDNTLESQKNNIQTQQTIDSLANNTRDMQQEYKTLLHSTDSLTRYNNQLEVLIENQQNSLISIERQMGYIESTQRDIVPLMLRMIEVLEVFISLDFPFLTKERQERLLLIKEMMDRPDVTLPDKFRRVMEAYQIEMEYGRTIEAYEDTILINDKSQTVDILRIGRLTLIYSTLDKKAIGQWHAGEKRWAALDKSYHSGVQKGLKIARNQAPPDLFRIPVKAPEKIQ